jgi:superfamily I DNA/RNA helicase
MEIRLDKNQERAVRYERGNLMVIAGPGAGKTRIIIGRMQHLIKNGVQPDRILAVTFTNKAADEIQDRINISLENNATEPLVSTFHSFALRILRDFYETAGLNKYFTVIDEEAQDEILKNFLRAHGVAPSVNILRRLRSHLDYEKANVCYPIGHPNVKAEIADEIGEVFKEYQRFLIDNNAVDFNDLILLALMVLQGDEDARMKYRNRYDHILLDEFQDINRAQFELTRLIVRDDARVLAVADSDQMIYNWRGSNPELIKTFLHDYNAEKIELTENYRSASEIILATKSLISYNKPLNERKLKIPENVEARVGLIEVSEDKEDASIIAKIVESNVARGYKFGDIAIIYRMHGIGDDIEQELSTRNIPLLRIRPSDEFIRSGLDQLMCYLRLSQNMFDWDVKSAWDFPRRFLNPLEGYRITSLARSMGTSLYKMVSNPQTDLNISTLAQFRLKRFTGLVENLALLGEELSPSGYFRSLRKSLSGFLSPFIPVEEERLLVHLGKAKPDSQKLSDILLNRNEKPYVLILHQGGVMLHLASMMIAKTLKDYLNIPSQISVSHKISDSSWERLSHRITSEIPLVVIHLGHSEKSDLFLGEFWTRGLAFEFYEIKPQSQGDDFLIALSCFRFLIDLLTRMPENEEERLVFYDLETTGIDTRKVEIIELSALATKLYSEDSQTYNSLVKPSGFLPPEITDLTGITAAMLKDALPPNRVIDEFDAFSRGAVLIGHNIINYDNQIMERYYPTYLKRDFLPENIDTVLWARDLFPGQNNSLAALGERFKLSTENLHRAGEDVRLNREVFYRLFEVDCIKRGLDFSRQAVVLMALMALEREEPEKGAGRAFLSASIRILANDEIDIEIIKSDLEKSFEKSTCDDLMGKIDLLKKEKYPDDPQRERWESLADYLGSMILHYEEKRESENISGFVNHYTLLTESDYMQEGNTVKMMSIHAAKGLEFPIVIISGLEQGSIPHYLALDKLDRIEEERRLLYVAMTRAREKLYLVYSQRRDGRYRPPSMFLQEIPSSLMKKYKMK